MDTIKVVVVVVVLVLSRVQGLMVMDEPSCHDVEEAECGVCHTLYMEECKMEMVAEMVPKKVSMCRNVTRYEEKCLTKMSYKMVEEKRPICKLEIMKSAKSERKKMKKKFPKSECRKVPVGQQEECVDMVKLQEEQ